MKICILSEYAYSIYENENAAGGAELQMTILAKELVNRSYDVSLVTFGKSKISFRLINGVKVYHPFYLQGKGYVHFYPKNLYKLFKILNKIDADIYIQRATTPLTGLVAFFAKLKNKVFVYSVSSNACVSSNLSIKGVKDLKKLIYKFGVKNSDSVICQTKNQKDLLKKTIGKQGVIIKNMYIPPKLEPNKKNTSILKVLWVGRAIKEKRPELFLKLAKNLPNIDFCMIASLGGSSSYANKYFNDIKEAASKINNLDFKGFVPYKEINKYYAESSLVVNTSYVEGFPNTFLEAWGNYNPIITLDFDPDEIICKYKLGLHSKTFEQLIEDTKALLKNDELRKEMGNNSRKYVEKEHNLNNIINEYELLIKNLVTRDG
jgi:glycosyltransferase involved in cell wall biosynthesis